MYMYINSETETQPTTVAAVDTVSQPPPPVTRTLATSSKVISTVVSISSGFFRLSGRLLFWGILLSVGLRIARYTIPLLKRGDGMLEPQLEA
jgi:hypothetical protein